MSVFLLVGNIVATIISHQRGFKLSGVQAKLITMYIVLVTG